MGQEALAEAIRAGGYPISTSMISSIERHKDRPSRATAAAIDQALGARGEVLSAFGYTSDEATTRLAAVEAVARAQGQVLLLLGREAIGRLDAADELAARLDDLERLLAAQQAR